jgi:DNA-binding winged helix-turn-helix (wHTH) protein/tetratricopeptide (TPR) repeat protein
MRTFHTYRLDTANQCLWHRDARADLTPKAFDVLRYLVEHAGRLVTPAEILEALWPNTYVNPEGIRRYIQEIRKVLGDPADTPVFIATLPKRGYQFIAPVSDGSTAQPSDVPTEGAKPIVGREPALAELERGLSKARVGQRQVVFITGELGIGKTTLVDEFQRRAATNLRSIRLARGQCVEGYGGKEPYYPMLEALAGLWRRSGGEPLVQILAAHAPTWLVQFPALVTREHRETLQREILGATRERMLREIGEVLETVTADHPLLLVFEDLHWADPSTVDLISALARRRSPAKLMVIATYRPVDVIVLQHPLHLLKQDLLVHQLCHEIALEPLGEADVAEYLAAESWGASPPDGLASLLYQQSEGNPLFMVTALNDMTERGLISRENGSWQPGVAPQSIDLVVPNSLQQMIEVQIDRLNPQEQRVLEVASLESVGISRFAVARGVLIDLDPETFEDTCETLSRRHRIVRLAATQELSNGTVSACYEFVHVLYREVCYRRIPPARRAKLHRRLAEWVEAQIDRSSTSAGWLAGEFEASWLAGHFEQGGDWVRAIKYLQRSAVTAGRRCEPRQAAEILEHARELVSKLPEADRAGREIEILEKLAAIYVALVDGVHAVDTYDALAVRAAHDGLIDVEVRALIDMAYALSWNSSQRSLEVLHRALSLSAHQEDPLAQARARAHCSALRLWQEWNLQDAEEFQQAFSEILNASDRRILAPYLADRGFIRWISSEYREAHRSLIESRAIQFETIDANPYLDASYVRGRFSLAWTLMFLGEWGEALREIDDAMIMFDKNANDHWGQGMRLHRAWVNLLAMDCAGVLAICNPMLPLISDLAPPTTSDHPAPYPAVILMCLFLTGSAETALGHHERAREHLLAARAIMDRSAVVFVWVWRMPLESALTELWLATGDAQARPQAERFLKIALATEEHTWRALAWEVNARVAMAERDLTRAQDCIAKGLSAMEGFEVPLAAWRVHATAFELHQNSGDRDVAEHHLALSRETVMKLANSLPQEEALRQAYLSAPVVRRILGNNVA